MEMNPVTAPEEQEAHHWVHIPAGENVNSLDDFKTNPNPFSWNQHHKDCVNHILYSHLVKGTVHPQIKTINITSTPQNL